MVLFTVLVCIISVLSIYIINYLIDLVFFVKLGKGSYAFLIDDQGNIVTHLNEKFKPKEEKLYNIDEILYGKTKYITKGKKLDIKDRKIKDYDGADRFFFFGNIEESNWKVGVGISTDYALGNINKTIKHTIIAVLIVLIISIAIST